MVDGELLEAMVAFAETLNFTHAASRVHLSQPALFERVRRLGELAGGPLYERQGRALRLTDLGQRLAAFARDTLARGDALARELAGEAPRPGVTLAAGEGAYLYLLGPALARFAAADHAQLRLLTTGAAATVKALLEGEADVGVTVVDLPPASIEARDLVRAPVCAALPTGHRLARRRSVHVADLARDRLILPPAGRLVRDLSTRFVAMHGHTVEHPLEADGWPLMLTFVAAGLGVAIVNGTCHPPAGVTLRPMPELGHVTYRVLTRRSKPIGEPARALVDALLHANAKRTTRRERDSLGV